MLSVEVGEHRASTIQRRLRARRRDAAHATRSRPYHSGAVTAKEQLRERVERLTDDEAAETLRLLDQRSDALTRLLDDAPLDDEPTTPEEEAAVQEALAAAARGETITLEELRAELDAEPR
jgi:hypothetical protein